MIDTRVARRYAQALFNAAKDRNELAKVEEDLNGISASISGNDNLKRYLHDPTVAKADKQGLLDRVFSGKVNQLSLSIFHLLLEKGREAEFEGVRLQFADLRRIHEQVAFAIVTSSQELEEDQRRKLVEKLARSLGKTVEAEYHVDPHLIGGITVSVDNVVLDGSLKGSLSKIRERIVRDALKQS